MTHLGNDIDQAATTGATCEPTNDIKGTRCEPTDLEITRKLLELSRKISGLAGEQEPSQTPLLTTERFTDYAMENIVPLFAITNPWPNLGIIVDLSQDLTEI